MKLYIYIIILLIFLLTSCRGNSEFTQPVVVLAPTLAPLPTSTETLIPTSTPTLIPRLLPDFAHIVIIVFENREFGRVIRNPIMPYFNLLAESNTLLTQHYATTHPSLPNYISLIGGDTFGITQNCEDCFIDQPSLPDFIEESGRTWKAYQEDMPSPCFAGSTISYQQKHNPFIYFDPIRLNPQRCESIVPLNQFYVDIASQSLPNFSFITPNACNSAHDCDLDQADLWLKSLLDTLIPALDVSQEPYLVILTWDEGQGDHSCCGMPDLAGGRVATILISPQAQTHFKDETPYSHYSILKSIAESWGLPYLGHAADLETNLILAPFE